MTVFSMWFYSWHLTSNYEGFCFGGFMAEHEGMLCTSEHDFDLNNQIFSPFEKATVWFGGLTCWL